MGFITDQMTKNTEFYNIIKDFESYKITENQLWAKLQDYSNRSGATVTYKDIVIEPKKPKDRELGDDSYEQYQDKISGKFGGKSKLKGGIKNLVSKKIKDGKKVNEDTRSAENNTGTELEIPKKSVSGTGKSIISKRNIIIASVVILAVTGFIMYRKMRSKKS